MTVNDLWKCRVNFLPGLNRMYKYCVMLMNIMDRSIIQIFIIVNVNVYIDSITPASDAMTP